MANSSILAILLLISAIPAVFCVGHHAILQLQVSLMSQVKTGSHLEIEVINENLMGCIIDNAIDPGAKYDEGSVILIEEPFSLGACFQFPGPVREVVTHYNNTEHGLADFGADFYRVLLSDSTFTDCPDGQVMENGAVLDLQCGNYDQVHDDDGEEEID